MSIYGPPPGAKRRGPPVLRRLGGALKVLGGLLLVILCIAIAVEVELRWGEEDEHLQHLEALQESLERARQIPAFDAEAFRASMEALERPPLEFAEIVHLEPAPRAVPGAGEEAKRADGPAKSGGEATRADGPAPSGRRARATAGDGAPAPESAEPADEPEPGRLQTAEIL